MPSPTIYRRKDSRWWWIARIMVKPDGSSRRLLMSGRALGLTVADHTHEEAQALVNEHYRIDRSAGTDNVMGTVGWLRDMMPRRYELEGMRYETFRLYRIALNHFADALGENTRLESLTRHAVSVYQDHLLAIGNRTITINKNCRHIRAAIQRLVDDDMLISNPFARFKPLPARLPERRHLTLDDLRRFLAVVNASPNEAGRRLVMISLYTGLRRREVLELPRDAIDLGHARILAMNIKHHSRRRRWISVSPEVSAHLGWFLDRSGSKFPLRVCHHDTYSHWVKVWLAEAGLPGSLHLHSLRHTFVTHALAQGIPAWHIKDQLDHSSITVTEGYAHTSPEIVNIRYGFEET